MVWPSKKYLWIMISPGYYFQIKEQFSLEYPQQKNNKLKTKWACFFALEFFMLFWPLYPKKEIKRGKTFLKVSEKKDQEFEMILTSGGNAWKYGLKSCRLILRKNKRCRRTISLSNSLHSFLIRLIFLNMWALRLVIW